MLSVIINVKNGEKYLARCLGSLVKFDEVVLVENYSTANNIEMAKKYPNVKVFEHEFCGMEKLRNIASNYAKNDWLFWLNSDEVITPELAHQLLNMQFKSKHVYRILRKNYYDNYYLNSSSWENDWVSRVFNRKEILLHETDVPESINAQGMKELKLKDGYIAHFAYAEVSTLFDKIQLYSTVYARQNSLTLKPKLFTIPFRAVMAFFNSYILHRGFLDGYEGFLVSSTNAIEVFAKNIKLYELHYKLKLALAVGVIDNLPDLQLLIKQINMQQLLPHEVFVLVDDKLLEVDNTHEVNKLLNEQLLVPATVIGEVDQDIGIVLNSYMINRPDLKHIIYLPVTNVLADGKMFKKSKTAILNGVNLPGIEVFSN